MIVRVPDVPRANSMRTDCLAHCPSVQHLLQSPALSWCSGYICGEQKTVCERGCIPGGFCVNFVFSGLRGLEVGRLGGKGFSSNIPDRRSLISCPDHPITSQDSPYHLAGRFLLTLGKDPLSYNFPSLSTTVLWVQLQLNLPYL